MLIIRNEQMKVLRDGILLELQRHAQDNWLLRTRPEPTAVQVAVERAQTYGINSQRELRDFLSLGQRLGLDFDLDPEHRWAQQLLQDADLAACLKLSLIESGLRQRGSPSA